MADEGVVLLLSRMMMADAIEDALAAASELLAGVTGASTAAFLLSAGDEITVGRWHGAEDALRERVRPLITDVLKSGEGRDLKLEGLDATWLRISPLRSGDKQLGVVVLAFDTRFTDDRAGKEIADRVVEIVAAKLDADRRLATSRSELAQIKRWFDILDNQMRVLDRERQKFAAVVSQSDTLMFVADDNHVARWTNSSLKARLEALGSSRVVGLGVQEIWDKLGVGCAPSGSSGCPIARVFRESAVVHVESRQVLDDEMRDLYLTLMPIKAVDGTTAEVLVMIQDLSDLDLLRRSEARYRLLFERSPDAMIMAEPESGRILLTNPAASALTGYTTQELTALTLEEIHEQEDWGPARDEYVRIVGRDTVEYSERQLHSKQGQTVVANVTASRFDLDGQPVTLLVLQDVTKQRHLEMELMHSQKMEVVGRLAAGITHEFNNIMTVILAQAEMLKMRSGADNTLQEIADTTEKAAFRAALLTRKLLAFSRKEMVKTEVLDLNEVVRTIGGLLRNLLGERVTLHMKVGVEPCLVKGDRTQLEEIVINLAANARDAMMREGNFWLEVSRREAEEPGVPGQVLLSARDDGIGMDTETKDRLFEPFFTTKAPHAGTGLGMSTISRIVERHDGTIEVASEPSTGTTFLITLPGVDAPSWTPQTEAEPDSGTKGEERILLVDDEPAVLRMTAQLLRIDGFEVEVAASAKEALAICEAAGAPFHLLITDVVMPGMTGGELWETVRRRFPETRVLYLSGYTDEDVVRSGVSRSEAAFLQKPFTRKSLSQKVREVLDS